MPAQAYPYASWPRVSRAETELLRRVLRALPMPTLELVREAAALLGAPLRLTPATAELWDAHAAQAALGTPMLALWLEHGGGARALPLLCELPVELGALLVDRLLGGEGLTVHQVGESLDDLSAGVLGYFAARLAGSSGSSLRLQAVLTSPAQARPLLGSERVLICPFALELAGKHAGTLRMFVPEASAIELALRTTKQLTPPIVLGGLPLVLCAHACQLALPRAELARLAPGDVVVPEHCRLTRGNDGWRGEVELHVTGSLQRCFWCTAHGDELVIDTRNTTGEPVMSDAKRIEPTARESGLPALAGDAPVMLCLELCRFTLTLDELSALRPGEVLKTGRAIGESATLSAAGHPIARGELVEVEGEIGLRIVELVR